ncbi:MFS general substrate transporter [Teratosphaeria nubilosa]|uniref:MFS general substrate transporter n=1 Tax=Teratosphaeria nubilosa TaxID=161662 RepID=A0A6G1L520_9PEZI|nr:MFS general substrate transporter [Teratosphaeria nubilosa]
MALGPLFGSPLSETPGRKAVVLATTPIFALFTLGAGLSTPVAGLITCRFFAGVFAAPAIGNASATITDYTAGRYRAVTMSFYYSIPTFGAVLGPLIGGFIVEAKGWRWTQWTIVFFIIVFYVPIIFAKETYKKVVSSQRAKKLGIAGPTTQIMTPAQALHYYATKLLIRPAHMLLTESIVSLVCLYSGFLFGLMYTSVTASSWVYQYYYNFNPTQQSLSFLGLITGTLLAPLPLISLDLLVYQPRLAKYRASLPPIDQFPPEHRLFPAMIASPLMPVFLFIFAWTTRPDVRWIVPIVFQGLAMCCSVIIYAPSNLFMMDTYGPLYGASAAGAAMLSRYTLSAIFPLFSLQMYRALGVGWATSLLAFCTALLAPVPWLFWRCSHRLRARIRYETST